MKLVKHAFFAWCDFIHVAERLAGLGARLSTLYYAERRDRRQEIESRDVPARQDDHSINLGRDDYDAYEFRLELNVSLKRTRSSNIDRSRRKRTAGLEWLDVILGLL